MGVKVEGIGIDGGCRGVGEDDTDSGGRSGCIKRSNVTMMIDFGV